MYIYTHTVGFISGPHFVVFRVYNWATIGSITGPHHCLPLKIVVSDDFCEPGFEEGGAEFSSLSGILVQKQMAGTDNPWYLVFVALRSPPRKLPNNDIRADAGTKLPKSDGSSKPTRNLHSPVWAGPKAVVASERVHIWVCLFLLYGWSLPGVMVRIWVCLICVISTYSNRAV